MIEKIIERTDFSEPRLVAATKSLIRYYEFETDRLTALKRGCNEELERHPENIEVRDELQRADNELRDLQAGWKNSSLRNKLLKSSGEHADSNRPLVEKRLLMSAQGNLLQAEPRAGGGSKIILYGRAAVCNVDSLNLGGFIERIAPGAFTEALKISDVRGLVNHSADLLLGRTKNKTLRLYEDSTGLRFYIDLLEGDDLSQGVASRVRRGDWSQCSFAFTTESDKWIFAKKPGDADIRIILKIKELFDISIVSYPAYLDTTVGVLFEQKRSEQKPKSTADGRAGGYELLLDDDDEGLESVRRLRRARESLAELDYKRAGRILDRCKTQLS